jgi:hypothetical protein
VFEITCQSCGDEVKVQSFLAAAQQPCSRCGQLLMGQLSAGGRTVRPAGFETSVPGLQMEPGRRSSAGMLLGMLAGAIAGVALVAAVARMGPVMTLHARGAVLGALSGVLLAPVLVVTSFLSMILLPFSLEGLLGDSVWGRLARANNERRLGPLVFPFIYFVALPMGLCGFGGSRMTAPDTLVVSAGLGAIALGALIGSMGGALVGRRKSPV